MVSKRFSSTTKESLVHSMRLSLRGKKALLKKGWVDKTKTQQEIEALAWAVDTLSRALENEA